MRKILKYLLLGIAFSAWAFQAAESAAEPVIIDTAAQAGDRNLVELGQVLSDENLDWQTGRQDTKIDQLNMQLNDVNSNAQMDSNILSANGSTFNNGANSVGGSSFSNAAGLVTVIQNSGNQVLIKNDMILNLSIK